MWFRLWFFGIGRIIVQKGFWSLPMVECLLLLPPCAARWMPVEAFHSTLGQHPQASCNALQCMLFDMHPEELSLLLSLLTFGYSGLP